MREEEGKRVADTAPRRERNHYATLKAMNDRWTVLQHAEWEGPGIIAGEAQRRGFKVDIRRLDRGDALPCADQVDGLVAMGGPLGAYEVDQNPFLGDECALLREMARRERPVLGVCLGAQLLAKALGASVYPGGGPEIGFGTVELTAAAKEDPLFLSAPDPLPVFHWHGDTFTLPEDAVLLASSRLYPHQAFRYGTRVYGLQFHVEPDADTWSAWQGHLPDGTMPGSDEKRRQIELAGAQIIARFFDHVS